MNENRYEERIRKYGKTNIRKYISIKKMEKNDKIQMRKEIKYIQMNDIHNEQL